MLDAFGQEQPSDSNENERVQHSRQIARPPRGRLAAPQTNRRREPITYARHQHSRDVGAHVVAIGEERGRMK